MHQLLATYMAPVPGQTELRNSIPTNGGQFAIIRQVVPDVREGDILQIKAYCQLSNNISGGPNVGIGHNIKGGTPGSESLALTRSRVANCDGQRHHEPMQVFCTYVATQDWAQFGVALFAYSLSDATSANITVDQNYGRVFVDHFRDPDAPEIVVPEGQCWNPLQTGTNCSYPGTDFLSVKQLGGTTGCLAIAKNAKSSGKWYFEITTAVPVSLTAGLAGVTRGAYNLINSLATTGADDYWYDSSGRINTNGSPAEATNKPTWDFEDDTVGVLLDIDSGLLDFIDRTGNVFSGFSGLPAGTYYPVAGHMSGAANGNVIRANFSGPFVHTPPVGYLPFE